MLSKGSGTWISWNENLSYPYENLYQVSTEEELSKAIAQSDEIRFFGTKQSSADIAAGSASLIDMRSYNKILATNDAEKLITVQSGVVLVDLIEAVEAKGWCIPCLPDINTVTVGGALATGTHGTSGKLLSEYLHSCSLVLADGTVKQISSQDDLMNAVRVSIGVLGVFSELTFKCEELYTLHLKEGPEKDKVWLNNIESDLKKYDFLRVLWLPHTGKGYSIKGSKIKSDQEIKEFLSDRFGNQVLYNPGLNKDTYFLWFAPILFLILVLLTFFFRKKT